MTETLNDMPLLADAIQPAHDGSNAGEGALVYAYGHIQAYFPSLSVEREFYQALLTQTTSPDNVFNVHDEAGLIALNQAENLNSALYKVLSLPMYASIAREMCWTLQSPSGSELYLVDPQNAEHLAQLVAGLKPEPDPLLMQRVFVGRHSSGHSNPLCAAWALQAARFVHLFEAPILNQPNPGSRGNVLIVHVPSNSGSPDPFRQLVQFMLQLAENSGSGDRNRTLNFVLLNQANIYQKAWDLMQSPGLTLARARVEPLEYGGNPGRARVIFDFGSDSGAVQSWFYIIDAASAFPYVVTDLQRFINSR